jgi:hypothetical protein
MPNTTLEENKVTCCGWRIFCAAPAVLTLALATLLHEQKVKKRVETCFCCYIRFTVIYSMLVCIGRKTVINYITN